MFMEIDDVLHFASHHTTGDVTSCAQEIVMYITDHNNWQKPILPPELGCAEMEFQPERFDSVFNKWLCSQNFNGNYLHMNIVN